MARRRKLVAPAGKEILVRHVAPNEGVQAAYARALENMIDSMMHAVIASVDGAYLANPPAMASDETSASALNDVMEKLSKEWGRRFDDFAGNRAKWFANAATGAADRSYADALRDAGFTVRFKLDGRARDIIGATVAENVSLIKSLPQEAMTQVQGMVMRSVTTGRDLGTLAKELREQFGVTKRRAALIARDQNNKATAAITRARQEEIGVVQAVWLHSRGGRHPRPEHVAFSGKRYDVAKGAFLEGKWTWPGVEINCRCVSLSVIPALDG